MLCRVAVGIALLALCACVPSRAADSVDYREPDESIPQSGQIGLQIHGGPPGEAWYRSMVIRELPPAGPAAE